MTHLVVLVHGIRTFAYWMDDLEPVLEQAGFKVARTSYGRLNLLKFLLPVPWFRRKTVEKIWAQVDEAIGIHHPEQMSVISHSYGTYVIAKFIEKYPRVYWNRIIFCGSVLSEDFPFNQYKNRFGEIMNEVGTRDWLPALAQNITWGYGSIGANGLKDPAARNRWHKGLSHSDFLNPEFCKKFWIPFLQSGEIVPGDKAGPDKISQIISATPLRWIILLGLLLIVIFWPIFAGRRHNPEANIPGCDLYTQSTQTEWRRKYLRADAQSTYYVILNSITQFRSVPILNEAYAKFEAAKLRRKLWLADVDAFPTASVTGDNKMWAILLARALSDKKEACAVMEMANACGLSESGDAYVYRLGSGPVRCPPEGQ